MLLILNYGIFLIPKKNVFFQKEWKVKKKQKKKTFPFILSFLPLASACLKSLHFLSLLLRFKTEVCCSPNQLQSYPTLHLKLSALYLTNKTSPQQVVLSCAEAESLPVLLLSNQVWFGFGLMRGALRLRRAVCSLHEHGGDVLAEVDLTVSCYGLVLHQLQVLRG